MKNGNFKYKFNYFINPIIIITVAAVMRLLPHPPNVAPIAAMALFGGVYLNKKYALLIPLAALFVSDLYLGFYDLPMMLFVYGSFLITGFIGLWLGKFKNPKTILAASLISSLLFYVITNFGVWLTGTMYPKTFAGLMDCYVMAIPFFRNTLAGDLIYTGVFFGSFEIMLRLLKPGYKILNPK